MSNGRRTTRWPERLWVVNACRQVAGVYPDGQQVYVWTLADGSGLEHDHSEGRCPFGPGGSAEGQAEQRGAEFMRCLRDEAEAYFEP